MTSGTTDGRPEFAPPPPVRPHREGNPAWGWPGECSPSWCCTATGVCKAEESAPAAASEVPQGPAEGATSPRDL